MLTRLTRQLRAFTEGSGIPWGHVALRIQRDEDGKPLCDGNSLEGVIRHYGRTVEVLLMAPSRDRTEAFQGQVLPRGRLAGRFEDKRVVKGELDQATWDLIAKEMLAEPTTLVAPSTVGPEHPTAIPLEERWDERGRRISEQRRRSAFAHCRQPVPRGSGWAG